MNGMETPESASRSAILVWVNAPGINDDELDLFLFCLVDPLNQSMLGIGLKAGQAVTQARGGCNQILVDIFEGGRAVYLRLPFPEQVQVGPMQYQYLCHGSVIIG